MIQCPACLPPDNAGCATCGGTWSVTEETAAAFIEAAQKQEAANSLIAEVITSISLATSVDEVKLRLSSFLAE